MEASRLFKVIVIAGALVIAAELSVLVHAQVAATQGITQQVFEEFETTGAIRIPSRELAQVESSGEDGCATVDAGGANAEAVSGLNCNSAN